MCVDFVQCLCQLSRPTPTSFWTGIFGSGAFIKGIMKFWFSLSLQGSGRAVRIRHNLGVVLRSCGVSNNYFGKSMRSQLHKKTCVLGWYWSLGCCVVTRLSKSEVFKEAATNLWTIRCCRVEPRLQVLACWEACEESSVWGWGVDAQCCSLWLICVGSERYEVCAQLYSQHSSFARLGYLCCRRSLLSRLKLFHGATGNAEGPKWGDVGSTSARAKL